MSKAAIAIRLFMFFDIYYADEFVYLVLFVNIKLRAALRGPIRIITLKVI